MSRRHALSFVGVKSLTKQSFKDECNINNIMAQYQKSGLIEHANEHRGSYDDYCNHTDYHTALSQIAEAQSMFNELPATIRAKFDNSPAQFLAFVHEPDNAPKLVEMGLARQTYPNPESDVADVPATPENVDAPAATPAPE